MKQLQEWDLSWKNTPNLDNNGHHSHCHWLIYYHLKRIDSFFLNLRNFKAKKLKKS